MPFIGQSPLTGAYHVLDAITASGTATYNLQLNSGAFSPATANQLMVSLNGVIQKAGSSFTVSGSTITFSSALTSSDSIDFIVALGDVLNVGTPTDGTVSTAKIANSAVTDAKIAGMSASKLTGAMPALDGSALTGAGTVKHMQFANIAGDSGQSTTSLSYVATPVTITVAAADVAKCTRLVVQHAGSTRTDRNTHAHQQRRFQRTAPSAVNFDDYILGSVAGGSESLDNVSMTIVDANLGTGDHTYTVYVRKASGNNVYANNVYTQYRPSTIVVWGF
jgi:hypothetical protein